MGVGYWWGRGRGRGRECTRALRFYLSVLEHVETNSSKALCTNASCGSVMKHFGPSDFLIFRYLEYSIQKEFVKSKKYHPCIFTPT